jgi:3-oxoacyl-[acyl-carrier protein] reductase
MSGRFAGKAAVVTGAARGIGLETARELALGGAGVVMADIDTAALEKAAAEVRGLGSRVSAVAGDIQHRRSVEELLDRARAELGRLDILVNNAGVLITGTIEETTDEIIERTLNVNVRSILYAIRAAAPVMKAQRYGRIVNVASITGKNGDNSTVFVYGASKGAVISMTRSVARQLGPFGVTCNAVAPHAIMTDLMAYWTEDKKRKAAAAIPVGRLGTSEDVARLICFLASDEATFINGETVNINGGYYMD